MLNRGNLAKLYAYDQKEAITVAFYCFNQHLISTKTEHNAIVFMPNHNFLSGKREDQPKKFVVD